MTNRLFRPMMPVVIPMVALMAGCQTPVPNQGKTTTVPPDQRLRYEEGLASKDLVTATDEMVMSIATHPEFKDSPYRIQIVMQDVVNKTSMPNRNFEIYLARIRTMLNSSGARYDIGFVERKARVEELRRREGMDPPPSEFETGQGSPGGFASKADYALQGVFYDLPNAGTNYYLLTFQIVDLHDAQIVWEGSYEVKFD